MPIFRGRGEEDAIDCARQLLSYLPSNNLDPPPSFAAPAERNSADGELDAIIPDSPRRSYDMRGVIDRIVDEDDFLEVHELFAPNVICGLGRLQGRSIGLVANQPLHSAGCLNIDASENAARFVRTCDAFNVPIVTLVDVPGFLPGLDQERGGIIRRGAKLLYAYAEATVPKVTVVLRKAYGGAYIVMGSKHLRADLSFAWLTAEIAVMGAERAVDVLNQGEVADAKDPEELRALLAAEYEATQSNPYRVADRGYVDAVIPPANTRRAVSEALDVVST